VVWPGRQGRPGNAHFVSSTNRCLASPRRAWPARKRNYPGASPHRRRRHHRLPHAANPLCWRAASAAHPKIAIIPLRHSNRCWGWWRRATRVSCWPRSPASSPGRTRARGWGTSSCATCCHSGFWCTYRRDFAHAVDNMLAVNNELFLFDSPLRKAADCGSDKIDMPR